MRLHTRDSSWGLILPITLMILQLLARFVWPCLVVVITKQLMSSLLSPRCWNTEVLCSLVVYVDWFGLCGVPNGFLTTGDGLFFLSSFLFFSFPKPGGKTLVGNDREICNQVISAKVWSNVLKGRLHGWDASTLWKMQYKFCFKGQLCMHN